MAADGSPLIDLRAWSGLHLLEPAAGGNRNPVWRGRVDDRTVAVRRSRRPADSLAWELDLLVYLDEAGFRVPTTVPADDGRRSINGVVVQTWLDGRPPSSNTDWSCVAGELQRLHAITLDYPQRPGCCTVRELGEHRRSVDADLDAMPTFVAEQILDVLNRFGDVPTAVVHGDPGPDNLRIDAAGSVGLIDWDESRVDLTWHDLSSLGVQVLDDGDHRRARMLTNAWEAANGWIEEPAYARHRFELLENL